MLRSFRLKIGLLSVGLSGALLLGFGLYACSVIERVGRARIDRELRALADVQVRKPQPPGHWRRFADSLRSIYGDDASKQFVVVVASLTDGSTLYATEPWPADLPRRALPLSVGAPPPRRTDTEPPPNDRPGSPPADARYRARPFTEPPPREPPPAMMQVRGPVYDTLAGPGATWRGMTLANEDVVLSMAMNLSGLQTEVRQFRRALLIGIPLGLLLIVAGSWVIGQMALRPVSVIARTAESLTADRLSERIPEERADAEFARLIAVINGMLARLERSFRQATRFSADAAHELKTPLAVLQAQVERALQRAPEASPEQRDYAEQLEEVQRLKAILRKLLLLSQADAGQLPLNMDAVNLVDVVRTADEDVRLLAPDRRTTIAAPAALHVRGDADLLKQAVANLVSNAVKFGAPDGVIGMTLAARADQAVFTITNSGRPIPREDHGRVFDRFYRADKARGRDVEGSGLGLSLAREIARAHGGDLVLECSEGETTTFALTLPLAGT